MKNAVLLTLALTMLAFASCKENTAERDTTLPDVPSHTFVPFAAPVDSTNMFNASSAGERISAEKNATASLNPEHGKPGHRCDIAVGAPLNAAPVKSPQAPASQNNILPAQAGNNNSVGLNPPHGQPGHDCAIPVGEPLRG